jgi:hypothetical protein
MSVSSLDKLIEAYSQVGSANRRSLEALAVVLAELHVRGITCILLKGADLVPRLYGVWGLRPMFDVDLLVRECDLPTIDRVLQELGYHPQLDGNPAYRDPDGALALDLVTEVWYTDDTEGIWRRAIQHDLGGLPVLGMGAEDLLIFLTAYVVLYRGTLPSFLRPRVADQERAAELGIHSRRGRPPPPQDSAFHGLVRHQPGSRRHSPEAPPGWLQQTRERSFSHSCFGGWCASSPSRTGPFPPVDHKTSKEEMALAPEASPVDGILKYCYGLRGQTHRRGPDHKSLSSDCLAQSPSAKILRRLVHNARHSSDYDPDPVPGHLNARFSLMDFFPLPASRMWDIWCASR